MLQGLNTVTFGRNQTRGDDRCCNTVTFGRNPTRGDDRWCNRVTFGRNPTRGDDRYCNIVTFGTIGMSRLAKPRETERQREQPLEKLRD